MLLVEKSRRIYGKVRTHNKRHQSSGRNTSRKKRCTSDRVAHIETARLVLNDISPSELKEKIAKRLSEAVSVCKYQAEED